MSVFSRLVFALAVALAAPGPTQAQDTVVHAVLFYSPTCPHCHDVIDNHLPPIRQRFGEQFVIIGVDVSTEGGGALYQATVDYFALPQSRLGVPALVVGLNVLVGSQEIPEQLPGIIERGLATGGIDWPPVGAIRQVLAAQGLLEQQPQAPADEPGVPADTTAQPAAQPADPAAPAADTGGGTPTTGTTGTARVDQPDQATTPEAPDTGLATELVVGSDFTFTPMSPGERFMRDPVGNGVAVGALIVLLLALAFSTRGALAVPRSPTRLPGWLFPALAAVGLGIAAYLSYVEVTGTQAVCGPVGDCNTVQQSDWARLFGVIPVGVLGLAGYSILLAGWSLARWGAPGVRLRVWTVLWGMAWVGTAFSAYLTFLEPFVIGATCAWCVSSALVMGLLLVQATGEMSAAANGASTPPGPRTQRA